MPKMNITVFHPSPSHLRQGSQVSHFLPRHNNFQNSPPLPLDISTKSLVYIFLLNILHILQYLIYVLQYP